MKLFFGQWVCRANGDLYLLCGRFTHEKRILKADITDNRLVHLVAGDPDRPAQDNSTKGNHRNFTSPAPDIDYKDSFRILNRKERPDCCSHWLLDQIGASPTALVSRPPARPRAPLRGPPARRD